MKQITTAIIIVFFLVTIGTTYIIVDSIKNQEITDLKNKYDTEISNLNATISDHDTEINNLTVNLDRYRIIGKWSSGNNMTNYRNFTFYENNSFKEEEGNSSEILTKWGTFEISEVGCIHLGDTLWVSWASRDQCYRYSFGFLGNESELVLSCPECEGLYPFQRIK